MCETCRFCDNWHLHRGRYDSIPIEYWEGTCKWSIEMVGNILPVWFPVDKLKYLTKTVRKETKKCPCYKEKMKRNFESPTIDECPIIEVEGF